MTIEEIMEILPAPDYPTGGVIMGTEALRQAYLTGKGGVVIRSKTEIEEDNDGKAKIDNTLCVGCGVCKQLCAFDAIV